MRNVNFDTQLLRSFVTILETGSFVAAADKLNMTQPAISQQMRRLEELAGHGLFQREGRKFEVTQAGERLARLATQILALNDEIPEQLGVATKNVIHIGMPEYYSDSLLPTLLGEVHVRLPDVQLLVKIARSRILGEWLAEGRLDIALTMGESEPKSEIANQTIPIQWLAGSSFELERASGVIPLVMFKQPCVFRQIATERLDQAGMRWKCEHECEDLRTLRAALRANVGIAPVPFIQEYREIVAFDNHRVLPGLPDIMVRLRRNERFHSRDGDVLAQMILRLWAPPHEEALRA